MKLNEQEVNVRIKLAGLWTAMLFIFAYVDIFGFYRADIINGALNGTVGEFDASQTFFLLTTLYVLIPSLLVYLTLVLKARLARNLNIVFAVIYILTIIGAAVSEDWAYYIAGSIFEVILLAVIVRTSLKWPKE